jgi:superfamily II DNA/RNA helicase
LNFSEFDLHPDLLDGIDALNYTTATPIQEQAIPIVLAGKDLIGIAQTGTGKTAAFILPIIHKIIVSNEANYTQALVIVPTRELAVQIDKVVQAYSYFTGVSSAAIYGGSDGKAFAQEKTAITDGADILIATPGRLLAHMNLGYVDFKRLRFLVLDEADRMLDMGFMPAINSIINTLNPKRQNLLFSATMPPGVLKLTKNLLHNPETIKIALSKPAEGVTQGVYMVHDQQKIELIARLLHGQEGKRILIFGSTKASVSSLYQKLRSRKMHVGQISSDLEQDQRNQVMLDYRNRHIDILIATDVLSRGIDIDGIDLVINFDVPRDPEDYVHRIGRTARAGSIGTALTLVSPKDQPRFVKIEKLIDKKIDRMPLPEGMKGAAETKQSPHAHHAHGPKRTKPAHSPTKTAGEQKPGPEALPNEDGKPREGQKARNNRNRRRRRGKGGSKSPEAGV